MLLIVSFVVVDITKLHKTAVKSVINKSEPKGL